MSYTRVYNLPRQIKPTKQVLFALPCLLGPQGPTGIFFKCFYLRRHTVVDTSDSKPPHHTYVCFRKTKYSALTCSRKIKQKHHHHTVSASALLPSLLHYYCSLPFFFLFLSYYSTSFHFSNFQFVQNGKRTNNKTAFPSYVTGYSSSTHAAQSLTVPQTRKQNKTKQTRYINPTPHSN